MTRHINATNTRGLLFSVFFIACSAVALPAFGDEKKVSNGCTMSQIQSPQGTRCIEKMDEDLMAKRTAYTQSVLPWLGIEMLHQAKVATALAIARTSAPLRRNQISRALIWTGPKAYGRRTPNQSRRTLTKRHARKSIRATRHRNYQ